MRRPWLVAGLAGVATALWLRPFRVAVEGRSMVPTLLPGDYLLVTRAGRIRRGAVVVVAHPSRGMEVVKRVAAVPGDIVDGRPLPPGRYLVVGDNRAGSTDGRTFGPVERSAVLGVVRFRYWPRAGPVRHEPG
jgi:nickel-type superoxide dismutase maturation protease